MTDLPTLLLPYSNRLHVAITGNIGAGKTTLAHQLSTHFGWRVFYEAVEGNPYLNDFYQDMARWAFHLQVYFLRSRYEQVLAIAEADYAIIQDRTIYEDAHIFAKNLHATGLMSLRDYENYRSLFDLMLSVVRPPDLMIYLRADVIKLEEQIKLRDREFERNISHEYLENLNRLYDEFTREYSIGPLLTIDVNGLDFAHQETDWHIVLEKITEALGMRNEKEKARRTDGLM